MTSLNQLPQSGFIRLKSIIGPSGPLPYSRSTWYAGIKAGRFPKPVALGPRAVGYRVTDIRALIDDLDRGKRPSYQPQTDITSLKSTSGERS